MRSPHSLLVPSATGPQLVGAAPAVAVRERLRRFWPDARPYRRRSPWDRSSPRASPVLVLDEPTTGLDAAACDALLDPLRTLAAGRAGPDAAAGPRAAAAVGAGGSTVERAA